MMSSINREKITFVKELLKQNLKSGRMCCCAKDDSFQCRNCKLVDSMQAPREHACVNCFEVEA
jgi:hypothetical protein